MKGTKNWETQYLPSFKGLSCYVLPGAGYGEVVVYMASGGFTRADKPEDADLVVFIGGTDVGTALYGQKSVMSGPPDIKRDIYEKTIFDMCKRRAIPMFGICRGAQFLHVMNGGKLWQDVQNHAGRDHTIVDIDEDVKLVANSYHHQMVMDNDYLRIIAVTEDQVSRSFINDNNKVLLAKESSEDNHEIEIEAGAYDLTACLIIQGHPEWGDVPYKTWAMHKLHDFMFNDVGVVVDKTPTMEETIIQQIG